MSYHLIYDPLYDREESILTTSTVRFANSEGVVVEGSREWTCRNSEDLQMSRA